MTEKFRSGARRECLIDHLLLLQSVHSYFEKGGVVYLLAVWTKSGLSQQTEQVIAEILSVIALYIASKLLPSREPKCYLHDSVKVSIATSARLVDLNRVRNQRV